MTNNVAGHFRNKEDARSALNDLERNGFSPEDVSFIASEQGPGTTHEVSTQPTSGSSAPIGKGLAIGGASGLLLGLAALALPGFGPIVAAGPLAAALAGAGAGAAGGLIGALMHMGVPEHHAKRWSEAVHRGHSLVVVNAGGDRADAAVRILLNHDADSVERNGEALSRESNYDPTDPHTEAADFGDEGGSSQWGQNVLRPGREDQVAERTVSRDAGTKKLD